VDRTRVASGSPYEERYGFSRAVRVGDVVHVAGTAPVWPDGTCDPDPQVQAERCFEIAVTALEQAGATTADVVRTRMYLTDPSIADVVGRAHARALGSARPAATMVVVDRLVDERWLVEIEVEALVGTDRG